MIEIDWATDIKSFVIGSLIVVCQFLILYLFKKVREFVISKSHTLGKRAFLMDRRFVVLGQMSIILLSIGALNLMNNDFLSLTSKKTLTVIGLGILFFLLIKELNKYWQVGFRQITLNIARDTYQKSFNSTYKKFDLIGTNAFSFSETIEFENMLKRLRQCSGEIRILLAYPECNALKEAARNRDKDETLYQNQGKYSLGHIVHLEKKLGLTLNIKLYNAKKIEELPIFRAMFIDGKYCISSIAVYGRSDHGKNFPQIFAESNSMKDKTPQSMYNVVYRYFDTFWNKSRHITQKEKIEFYQFWQHSNTKD